MKKNVYVLMLFMSSIVHAQQSISDTLKVKSDTTKQENAKKREYLPLDPARKIGIKSTEGSWMSLDVSPDGQTIIFDFLGDLYTLPFTGGKAKPFLKGMSFESHPKFSPDGKDILFISDRSGSDNAWR